MIRPCALALSLLLCQTLGGAQASPLPDYPFVTADGSADIWLAPDIGQLQFEVVAQQRDTAQALARVEELSGALLALFAEGGVAAADIEAADLSKKTVALSARDDAGDPAQAYIVTRHFLVRVRDLQTWPGFIGALLGRDNVDNVSVAFDRVDRDQVNSRLVLEAAQNARLGAAELAQAFGRKPGPAVAITRGALDKVGARFGFGPTEGRAGAPPAPPPPAPGTLSYSVPSSIKFAQAVHAVFRLK